MEMENKVRKEKLPLEMREERMNVFLHLIGTALALLGLIFLLMKANTMIKVIAALIYGIALVFVMGTSSIYHMQKVGSKKKSLWRKMDYMSIYFLIAGTFAPILLVYLQSSIGYIIFAVQWVLVFIGVRFLAAFGLEEYRKLHLILYFIIGYSGLLFIPEFYTNNIGLLIMIVVGGIIYTVGMLPFSSKTKYAHSIWHGFVLFAALFHYLGIYLYIY